MFQRVQGEDAILSVDLLFESVRKAGCEQVPRRILERFTMRLEGRLSMVSRTGKAKAKDVGSQLIAARP